MPVIGVASENDSAVFLVELILVKAGYVRDVETTGR